MAALSLAARVRISCGAAVSGTFGVLIAEGGSLSIAPRRISGRFEIAVSAHNGRVVDLRRLGR
jgi:hypothetical protein